MAKLSPEMNSELRKAVTSFNRKIKRLEAKGVTASLLPERASVREIKNVYQDSEAINEKIQELASFTSRGKTRSNKKGVIGTDTMFAYADARNAKMAKIYKEQIKSARAKKGRYTGLKRQYISNRQAKIKYLSKSVEDMDARGILRQSQNVLTKEKLFKKNVTFRNNYIDKLRMYADIADIDRKTYHEFETKLYSIPLEDFYETITTNPEFNYFYDAPSVENFGEESIKRAEPKYSQDDVSEFMTDLMGNVDSILANAD